MHSSNQGPNPIHPPEPAAIPAGPTLAERVFVGPFGLRAAWGAAIFLGLSICLMSLGSSVAISTAGQARHLQQRLQRAPAAQKAGQPLPAFEGIPPGESILLEGTQLGAIAIATFCLATLERRHMRVFGIARSRLADLLPGAFWGLLSLSTMVGILRSLHLLVFDSLALHGVAIVRFGFEWLVMFFLVGTFEESYARGYLQYTVMRGMYGLAGRISRTHQRAIAFWIAAVGTSLGFAALHLNNLGENPMGLVMVFCAGIVFSYALWRTGSLWWGIGFHMAWDWAQSFLWGVPDSGILAMGRLCHTHPAGSVLLSGGADGPEGSLLVFPILLLVMLAIRLTPAGVQPTLLPDAARHAQPFRMSITNV
jgi:membrane protease YdiL (CAAX protease family)